MFSDGYGFVVDYIAEILRSLRNDDYSNRYKEHFTLSNEISTRDRDAINKTFSGLMKILFPHKEASEQEIEELLKFAIEGRKRIKDQLMRIDQTYEPVRFGYTRHGVEKQLRVQTLEEKQYPRHYHKDGIEEDGGDTEEFAAVEPVQEQPVKEDVLQEKHLVIQENQKGISFDDLVWKILQQTLEHA